MHQLGLYTISFYSRGKDATIKDFKPKSLFVIIHSSPNTKTLYTKYPISSIFPYWIEHFFMHWNPLHQTPHIFKISLWNWAFSCSVGSAMWRATKALATKEQCRGIQPLWVLKCLLTGLHTLLDLLCICWPKLAFILRKKSSRGM